MEGSEEYHYDLGYYEGCRNILTIINITLGNPSIPEIERIEILLELIHKELKDSQESLKTSEIRLYGYESQ